MKKTLIFSFILLNSIFTTSMFGMLTIIKRVTPNRNIIPQKNFARHYSQLEPWASLKSPKQVIQEIEKYWNETEKQNMHLLKINNRKKYNRYMQQARELLEDALVASFMCSEIMKKNKSDTYEDRLQNFHRFTNSWFFSDDTKSVENEKDVYSMINLKSKIMYEIHCCDVEKIEQMQDLLHKHIMNLRINYTYDKSRQILEDKNKE